MPKLTKANLEKQAFKDLVNSLNPLIKSINQELKSKFSNKDLPKEVELLVTALLRYQIYFKEIALLDKYFPETRGTKKDEFMNDSLMRILAEMWKERGNVFIPPLKDFIKRLDASLDIQISEEKCKQFLKQIKDSIKSKKLEEFAIQNFKKNTK